MPTISVFYGIVITMNLTNKEHNPPHIHAWYSGNNATFRIGDGELLFGTFPKRAKQMVKEFINLYREELLEMWEKGTYQKLKGIE